MNRHFTPAVQDWLRQLGTDIDKYIHQQRGMNPRVEPADYLALFNNPVIDNLRIADVLFVHSDGVPPGQVMVMRRSSYRDISELNLGPDLEQMVRVLRTWREAKAERHRAAYGGP